MASRIPKRRRLALFSVNLIPASLSRREIIALTLFISESMIFNFPNLTLDSFVSTFTVGKLSNKSLFLEYKLVSERFFVPRIIIKF